MKLKNILICGLGVFALTACNDYLNVDAPSSYTTDLVYSTKETANTALNGVYANILSGSTFGGTLYSSLQLNSDVDFASNSNENDTYTNPRRFDVNANSSDLKKVWDQLYTTIESANKFIEGCQNLIATEDSMDIYQMIGEAKFMRAMCYSELTWYFGDVPFTFDSTEKRDESGSSDAFNPDVATREVIWNALIEDLEGAAEKMNNDASEGVERISKNATYALIARLALQAAGYYLDSDDATSYKMVQSADAKKYNKIARDYAKKVIDTGTYSLENNFYDMYVKECNFDTSSPEAIFEIPFAKETTGGWGYNQGPAAASEDEGTSYGNWGKSGGSVRTATTYRYMFDDSDTRRDYVCGMFGWQSTGVPAINWGYTMYNNKWSKLWNTQGLGKSTESNTGINFAYLHYSDVLLMFAEADFKVNGVTPEAVQAVQQVRSRAFNGAADGILTAEQTSSDNFLKTILDERKFEFAGENMRWKDLVRNNMYGQELYWTFLLYYSIGQNAGGSAPYMDAVNAYYNRPDTAKFENVFPDNIYSCYIKNVYDSLKVDADLRMHVGYVPNTGLYMRYVVNPYSSQSKPSAAPNSYAATANYAVTEQTIYSSSNSNKFEWTATAVSWYNENTGLPKSECLYSFYGYIRGDESGNIKVVNGTTTTNIDPLSYDVAKLPAVRYIMPYPREVITRSNGKYTQKYGY